MANEETQYQVCDKNFTTKIFRISYKYELSSFLQYYRKIISIVHNVVTSLKGIIYSISLLWLDGKLFDSLLSLFTCIKRRTTHSIGTEISQSLQAD